MQASHKSVTVYIFVTFRTTLVTSVPVEMDTIIFNNGGHWDPVNHHFVVPQSGIYLFTVSMACYPGIRQGMFLSVEGEKKLFYKCGSQQYNKYSTTGTFGAFNLKGI